MNYECGLQSAVCGLQSAVCGLQSAFVRHRIPVTFPLTKRCYNLPNLLKKTLGTITQCLDSERLAHHAAGATFERVECSSSHEVVSRRRFEEKEASSHHSFVEFIDPPPDHLSMAIPPDTCVGVNSYSAVLSRSLSPHIFSSALHIGVAMLPRM